MKASFFSAIALCAFYVNGQPVDDNHKLTKSSLLYLSQTPTKPSALPSALEGLESGFVSFLTLLLLPSIPDVTEKHSQPSEPPIKAESFLDLLGFAEKPPKPVKKSSPKSSAESEKQLFLAMALQRLFGDSSESEEVEQNIQERLSQFKSDLMADPTVLEKSQEILTQLIRQKSGADSEGVIGHHGSSIRQSKVSSEEGDLDTLALRGDGKRVEFSPISVDDFAYRDEPQVRKFKLSSEERDLDTFTNRGDGKIIEFSPMDAVEFPNNGSPKARHFRLAIEEKDLDTFTDRGHGEKVEFSPIDVDTFAYRDGPQVRPFRLSQEEEDLDASTHRGDGGKVEFSPIDVDTFAYSDGLSFQRSQMSSEEDPELDTFAYRDEDTVRKFEYSSEEEGDTPKPFVYRGENGKRVYYNASRRDADLDLFAYRDDEGQIIRQFRG